MKESPTLSEVRGVLDTLGPPGTPLTTAEVAEAFDCTTRTIYNRLDTLVEDGVLETKKVGARGRVWWRPVGQREGSENQFIGNEPLHTVLESRIDQLCERHIGVYTLDTELRFTYCNGQAETWLGTTEAQLRGEFVWDAFKYVDLADDAYHKALDSGEPTSYLNYDESLEGWFENRVYPTGSGLTVYFTDITERKEAERELRERKRESDQKYRTLFDSIDEGFCTFEVLFDEDNQPEDFRFIETNPAFEKITGLADVEGQRMRELEPNHEDHWFEIYGQVAKTGEPERVTERAEHLGDRWYDVYAFRIGDPEERNVAVLFDDISERKRAEDELERTRDLLSKTEQIADVSGWEVDTETKEVHWTDNLFNLTGFSDDENPSIDEIREVYHKDDLPIVKDALDDALELGKPYDIEVRYQPMGDDELRWIKIQGIPETVDGEVTTLRGAVQDITEHKRRQEALKEREERLDAFVTATSEIVFHMSPDWSELYELNGQGFVVDTDESRQNWFRKYIPDDERQRIQEAIDEGIETKSTIELEHQVNQADGSTGWAHSKAVPILDDDDEIVKWIGTGSDITERKRSEKALRESEGNLQRLNTATHELIEATPDEIRDHAATLVQRVLDVEYTALWSYDETTGELEEVVTYSDPETDTDAIRPSDAGSDQIWQAFIGGDIVVSDLSTDERSSSDQQLRSQMLIPLGRHGVLYAGTTQPNRFDDRMVELAETLGATLETALDRAESEQELACQNEELERLDELNSLIRQIDQALVHAETRAQIDEAVCEKLSESARYEFAWIGEYDVETDVVQPRRWAGIESSSLKMLSENFTGISTDSPVTDALETHEVQAVTDIATDVRATPWREQALERGARSCVFIPLTYEQSIYGVLAVYSSTPQPDARETDILAEFGQTIAYSINAVETKTVLQTDGVVELSLRTTESSSVLWRLAEATGAELTVEGFVPGSETGLTVFFIVAGAKTAAVQAAAASSFGLEDVTCLVEYDERSLFRASVTDSASESICMMPDTVVRSVTVTTDATTIVVDIPHEEAVSSFLENVRQQLPDLELLARRPRDRPLRTRHSLQMTLTDKFTPRQLEVLQLAYRSGYFESPRVQTGNELAETLDIAHSTFTYHLRAAERQLCALAFDAP